MLGSLRIVFEHEKRGFVYGVDGALPQARLAIAECTAAVRDTRRARIYAARWLDS